MLIIRICLLLILLPATRQDAAPGKTTRQSAGSERFIRRPPSPDGLSAQSSYPDRTMAQSHSPGITMAHPPSPEAFVNAVFPTAFDSSFEHYCLIAGSDTCRFVKYNYDEWVKYSLSEEVPVSVLNELAEKIYLSHQPYFWKEDSLQNAHCITAGKADSLLSSPVSDTGVFSFSRPYFTDDGVYAVIDMNFICGFKCGKGTTFLFHYLAGRWKLIGRHTNWSS